MSPRSAFEQFGRRQKSRRQLGASARLHLRQKFVSLIPRFARRRDQGRLKCQPLGC